MLEAVFFMHLQFYSYTKVYKCDCASIMTQNLYVTCIVYGAYIYIKMHLSANPCLIAQMRIRIRAHMKTIISNNRIKQSYIRCT